MSELEHYKYFQDTYTPEDSKYCGWSSKEKQGRCFDVLSDIIQGVCLDEYNLLDVGCGIGDFCEYNGCYDYTGIDINETYIKEAKKRYPDKTFVKCGLRKYQKKHDYVIACGTFNIKHTDNIRYITTMIERMVELANKGVAFNLLSRHALGHKDKVEDLYYYDPGQIFNIVKHRWDKVSMRHDYDPTDFTIYIYK